MRPLRPNFDYVAPELYRPTLRDWVREFSIGFGCLAFASGVCISLIAIFGGLK